MAVYFRRSDWARALPYAEQVHQRVRERLGESHNASLVSRGNLGRVLYEMGRFDAAAAELRPAHAGLVASLGAEAPQSQDLAVVLAGVEIERGALTSAAALIDGLQVEALENQRGTGQWAQTVAALRGLRLERSGEAAAARALLEDALPTLAAEPDAERSRLLRSAQAALARLQGRARP
jgi:tetratricopeptide (TPR) repeat protein